MSHPLPPELTGPSGFKNFLYLAWRAIGLPDPTPIQYDIADWMHNGPDRQVTMAFRGVGKSYIASAFTVYSLLLDPSLNIMIVSGSKNRSDDFSTFTLRLIETMGDLTRHLYPRPGQRCSKISFDVGPAPVAHAPSVVSRGMFSQITGQRADLIIADDVVTSQNALTQIMRDKISHAAEEFNAILKPGGRILFLGTPQSEEDLLHGLPDRGFKIRIWPAEVPPKRLQVQQEGRLGPTIQKLLEDGVAEGTPTDPLRFDQEDLNERRIGYGRTGYAMQFLLDQSLADSERYPLKINDLIFADLDVSLCHERYAWTNDRESVWPSSDVPGCIGFTGDRYHKPLKCIGDMVPYQGKILAIDPSGKGSDETGYCVAGVYAGQIFILECGGLQGGYSPEVLRFLAEAAKRHQVGRVLMEENFGQGAISQLLKPVMASIGYRVQVEDIRHNIQKERRICDVLEPVMNAHRLIVNRKVLWDDWKSIQKYPPERQRHYSLIHQLSRITRDRGCLRHDDRLDVMAMAAEWWVKFLAIDAEVHQVDRINQIRDQQVRQWLADATSSSKTKIVLGRREPTSRRRRGLSRR